MSPRRAVSGPLNRPVSYTFARLLPYLWPQENKALRWRMALVLVVLVAGELATLSVPIVYSKVVDRFVHPNSLAMAPALLILCYGWCALCPAR